MDWILDHLQVIIAVAGAIAYWLNARKKEQAGEPADYDGDGTPDNTSPFGRALRNEDGGDDENTRRIQEEIRRKIAERQGGESPQTAPAELRPAPPPVPVHRREEDASPYAQESVRRFEAERDAAAVLERQRTLADQLAALRARRSEAEQAAKAMRTSGAAAHSGLPSQRSETDDVGLLRELRNARSLRKAIVLREVLGAPVALR